MPLNNFVVVGFYRIHRILPVLRAGGLTVGFDRMTKLVAQVLHIRNDFRSVTLRPLTKFLPARDVVTQLHEES